MAETEIEKPKLSDEQKEMAKWIKKHPLASHADFGRKFFGEDATFEQISTTIHTLVEATPRGRW